MTPEQLHACASKMTELLGVLEGLRTATLQYVEKLADAFGSTSSAPDGHGAALDELEGLSWSELSTELGHVGQIASALGNLGVIPDDVSTMLTQAATVGQLGIAWISATTPLGAAAAGAGLFSVLAGFFANRGDGIDAAHSLLRTQQQILQLQQETLKAVQQLAQHVRKLEDSIAQLRVDVARVNYGVWQARADLTLLLRDEIDTLADFVASLEEASLGELDPSLETLTRHYEQHGSQFRVGIHGPTGTWHCRPTRRRRSIRGSR